MLNEDQAEDEFEMGGLNTVLILKYLHLIYI